MKDKLRELVGELMSACEMIGYAKSGNERANHRSTRDKTKAELLAILDGDGDGGAVAWMSPNKERLEFSRPDTVYGSHTTPLYTHPARSGVVSDEDVEAAREAYFNAANVSDGVFTDSVAMRAALENFAKGERHER